MQQSFTKHSRKKIENDQNVGFCILGAEDTSFKFMVIFKVIFKALQSTYNIISKIFKKKVESKVTKLIQSQGYKMWIFVSLAPSLQIP